MAVFSDRFGVGGGGGVELGAPPFKAPNGKNVELLKSFENMISPHPPPPPPTHPPPLPHHPTPVPQSSICPLTLMNCDGMTSYLPKYRYGNLTYQYLSTQKD